MTTTVIKSDADLEGFLEVNGIHPKYPRTQGPVMDVGGVKWTSFTVTFPDGHRKTFWTSYNKGGGIETMSDADPRTANSTVAPGVGQSFSNVAATGGTSKEKGTVAVVALAGLALIGLTYWGFSRAK